MLCTLWLIFQSWALVEGGLTSVSAEALAKAGGKNVGGVAGNNVNAAAQNGVPLNGQAIVAQIVPLGGSVFLPQAGPQAGQQLIPIRAVQQGTQFVVGQPGGGGVGQVGQPAQGAPITLFAVLPQGGAIGTPQNGLLTTGQVHLISAAGLNQQQQQPALGNAGKVPGRLRFVRSAATRLRRTQAAGTKTMASEEEEEEEEEEEGSGVDKPQKKQ